jgi:hypothetical protein
MRFFALVDFQHFVLAFFLGLAAALVVYLAFRYTGRSKGSPGEGGPVEAGGKLPEYPEGLKVGDNPVPPVLILLFLGFVVWFIGYVFVFGIFGGPM